MLDSNQQINALEASAFAVRLMARKLLRLAPAPVTLQIPVQISPIFVVR